MASSSRRPTAATRPNWRTAIAPVLILPGILARPHQIPQRGLQGGLIEVDLLLNPLWDYVHEVDHMAERIQRAVIEALQALRGVAKIGDLTPVWVPDAAHEALTAVSIVAEVGSLSRFEFSSGNRIQRGHITKTGNAHLRRVIGEAAWAYQHRPWVGGALLKRQQGLDPEIKEIA